MEAARVELASVKPFSSTLIIHSRLLFSRIRRPAAGIKIGLAALSSAVLFKHARRLPCTKERVPVDSITSGVTGSETDTVLDTAYKLGRLVFRNIIVVYYFWHLRQYPPDEGRQILNSPSKPITPP